VIPDNNTIGLTDAHAITGLAPSISDVILTFNLSGGLAHDLTGYLRLGNLTGSPSYNFTSSLSDGVTHYEFDLSTFNGNNPNNTWTLFFADTDPGAENTLTSWSLEITAVPEPVSFALGIFGVLVVAGTVGSWLRRRTPVPHE